MNGAERIAAERKRQIEAEGFTASYDDENSHGEMALTATCYAMPVFRRYLTTWQQTFILDAHWYWDRKWWKPTPNNRIRELEKAGALIAAEIDRLLRLEVKQNG